MGFSFSPKSAPEISQILWDAQKPRLDARVAHYQYLAFEANEELAKMQATASCIAGIKAKLDGDQQEEQRQWDNFQSYVTDECHFALMKKQMLKTYNDAMTEYHRRMDALKPMELWDSPTMERFPKMYGENSEQAEKLHREVVGLDLEIRCSVGEGKALDDAKKELEVLKNKLMSLHVDNFKEHLNSNGTNKQ